jgi:phosphoglycerate dehydrogenase-like enzyme
VIAWASDPEALGPPPPGVEIVDRATPEVEFVVARWDQALALRELPALRVVQVLSAGVDWIADLVPNGVTLCSARGARDGAMAEWIAWALLADAKRARPLCEQQARGEWHVVPLGDLARRVLILGHGSIGRETAARLAPFGVEVVGVARRARPGVHTLEELPRLLPEADAVVNLLPATDATQGLVGAEVLRAMRRGALYVNAGRGATTDTDALVAALHDGQVRAVLDVTDPEPLPAGHPLWSAPGVIITPHHAGDTPAAERAAWRVAAEQLRRYAAGEPLRNVVSDGY